MSIDHPVRFGMNENRSGKPRGEDIRCPAVVPSLSFFALACMLAVSSATASQRLRLCVLPFEIRAGDRGLLLLPPGDPGYGVVAGKDYLIQVDDGHQIVAGKRGCCGAGNIFEKEAYP